MRRLQGRDLRRDPWSPGRDGLRRLGRLLRERRPRPRSSWVILVSHRDLVGRVEVRHLAHARIVIRRPPSNLHRLQDTGQPKLVDEGILWAPGRGRLQSDGVSLPKPGQGQRPKDLPVPARPG